MGGACESSHIAAHSALGGRLLRLYLHMKPCLPLSGSAVEEASACVGREEGEEGDRCVTKTETVCP